MSISKVCCAAQKVSAAAAAADLVCLLGDIRETEERLASDLSEVATDVEVVVSACADVLWIRRTVVSCRASNTSGFVRVFGRKS